MPCKTFCDKFMLINLWTSFFFFFLITRMMFVAKYLIYIPYILGVIFKVQFGPASNVAILKTENIRVYFSV